MKKLILILAILSTVAYAKPAQQGSNDQALTTDEHIGHRAERTPAQQERDRQAQERLNRFMERNAGRICGAGCAAIGGAAGQMATTPGGAAAAAAGAAICAMGCP